MEKAYPVYARTYQDSVATVRRYLETFSIYRPSGETDCIAITIKTIPC